MDTEAFVRWALDDARTVEERYTTELLVETGVSRWKSRRRIYEPFNYQAIAELKRQRAFNPAYQPRYTEESLRRAAEVIPDIKEWSHFCSHDDRPVRDFQVLRFLPNLETLHLHRTEVADVSPLGHLTKLKSLHFGSFTCEDLGPISRCTALEDLQLKLLRHWPEVKGIETLPRLESLLLEGNLLVFERAVFPTVKFANLSCEPLFARNVRDLPQLPACEFLSLGGVERLDGIEAYARLRNLRLTTATHSFAPLAALTALTCFTTRDYEPVDVTPLARVPALQFLCFNTWNKHSLRTVPPRDLAPLVEAPQLRELEIICNPILETEAAAIQAGLPSWGDLFLLPEPRPLPPWRLHALPPEQIPHHHELNRLPEEPERIDIGLRARELRWANRLMRRAIDKKLGTSDWSQPPEDHTVHQDFHPHLIGPLHREISIEFQSYGLIDKIPLVVEAMRETLASLRPDYRIYFHVRLTAPPRKPTKAEVELQEKFDREYEEAEYERGRKEREEYLERLHRYELRKQAGAKVDPEEFAPGEQEPLPVPPWEEDEDEDDEDDEEKDEDDDFSNDEDGGVAVKEKPEPPPNPFDDDHPLAQNYNLIAHFTLTDCYVWHQMAGVAEYLFQRPCDVIVAPEKKKEEDEEDEE